MNPRILPPIFIAANIPATTAIIFPGVVSNIPERNPPNPSANTDFISCHIRLNTPFQSIAASISPTFLPNSSQFVSCTAVIRVSRIPFAASLNVAPISAQFTVRKKLFRLAAIFFPTSIHLISPIKLCSMLSAPVNEEPISAPNVPKSMLCIIFIRQEPI